MTAGPDAPDNLQRPLSIAEDHFAEAISNISKLNSPVKYDSSELPHSLILQANVLTNEPGSRC